MTKAYLAGPMRGYVDFNKKAFDEATITLESWGFEVFSPAASDVNEFGSLESDDGDEDELAQRAGMTTKQLRRHVFEKDLGWICREADVVVLLPGWENSKGALAEKATAEALGLDVLYYESMVQMRGAT